VVCVSVSVGDSSGGSTDPLIELRLFGISFQWPIIMITIRVDNNDNNKGRYKDNNKGDIKITISPIWKEHTNH